MRKWKKLPRHPNIYEYETKKGKRYGIRRGFTNSVGKKDEYTKSGFKTWREADIVLKKFESDLAQNDYRSVAGGQITLDQAWKHFEEVKTNMGKWRQSTKTAQTNNYFMYIKPRFGTKKLDDIRKNQVQGLLNDLADKGLSHETLRSIMTTFNSIMNTAVDDELLSYNRIRKAEYKGKEPKVKMVAPEQVARWMNVAESILAPYDLSMIKILAGTGLRNGEITGLTTDAINFKKDQLSQQEFATIKIETQRSVHYPTGGPLKTKSSYRTIVVDSDLVETLKYAITVSNTRREKNHISDKKYNWLWLQENGNPCSPTHLRYLTKIVSKQAGIYIHAHMFRHYFATQAIASSVPQIDVMHYLGHSSVQMTADYTRETEHSNLAVFRGFSKVVSKVDGTKKPVPSNVPTNEHISSN